MAQISKITLPNGSAYDLKGSVYSVIGTQTASTSSWTGTLTALDALYDGLTIAYYLPYAGSENATLNLTLKNSVTTGAKEVYYNNQTRFTNQYSAGSVIWLTYFNSGSISKDGTQITSDRWIAQADSNNQYSLTKYTLDSNALFATSANNWVSDSTDYKLTLDTVLVSNTVLTSA